MALPPLQRVPHLERLLAPGEEIIYTARFSPLRGGFWLAGGVLCLLGAVVLKSAFLLAPATLFLFVWSIPFHTNEIAVTNLRLLYRVGDFYLRMEGLTSDRIETWKVRQTLLTSILHAGTVTIAVMEGRDLRYLVLPWIRNPMTFVEALETLQPELKTP